MTYTNPHYPRKYEINIFDNNGKGISVSDLRCTFAIKKRPIQSVNFADISIWNLSEQLIEEINTTSKQGLNVVVSAGYENGDYGQIFKGTIFQPRYDRENVTDFVLQLLCMDGDSLLHGNYTEFTLSAGYKYIDLINEMCRKSHRPIPIGAITDGLSTQKAPRAFSYQGDPWALAQDIASDNHATINILDGKLQVQKLIDAAATEAIVVSPESGLIGTPQQVDYGFSFRSLLTPKIALTNPFTQVKLNNTIILQQKAMPGPQQQYVSMLDHDMSGIVIETTYIGDTRGQEWYVDAQCVNSGGKSALGIDGFPEMISAGNMNPW